MVHKILYKPELREELIKAANGLSISQVAYKAGIAYESARKLMKMGHVPSEEVLERVASGLKYDLSLLRIAAGYDQPKESIAAVELALRSTGDIPEQGKKQVLDFVECVKAHYDNKPHEPLTAGDIIACLHPEFTREMTDMVQNAKQAKGES